MSMDRIRGAIVDDAPAEEFAALAIPEAYRAVTIHKDEESMFEGVPSKEKDPRRPSTSTTCRCRRWRPARR